MATRSIGIPIAVAVATVGELPAGTRARPDAERRASRLAARRAIRRITGEQGMEGGTIEIRRRAGRSPSARVRYRYGGENQRSVALALSHRDGRAAAIAGPAGALVGVDIERFDAIDSSHDRLYLTEHERRAAAHTSAVVLWTLKEAAWKALQLDGSVGFHELELHLDDAGEVRGVRCRGQWYSAVAAVVSPWNGYIMAVLHLERGR